MVQLFITFFAGCLLGTIFYGGLWYTVQLGTTSRYPAIWFMSSFLLRTLITLAGMYYVGAGLWERILLTLIGFIAARIVVTLVTKKRKEFVHENKS